MNLHNLEYKVNDETYKVLWPQHDAQTFNLIMTDWIDHSLKIIERLKGNRTVIQAGGHCGLYPKFYSNLFERVFTFEPDLVNFKCLVENCSDTRIVKINSAVGDKAEFVSMGIVSHVNTGMNKILPKNVTGIIAYSIPIDSMNAPNVDLIHLDVEGYEYEAIKGAVKTIKKYKPLVVLELSDKEEKVYNIMKKLNYKEVEVYGNHSKNVIFEHEG